MMLLNHHVGHVPANGPHSRRNDFPAPLLYSLQHLRLVMGHVEFISNGWLSISGVTQIHPTTVMVQAHCCTPPAPLLHVKNAQQLTLCFKMHLSFFSDWFTPGTLRLPNISRFWTLGGVRYGLGCSMRKIIIA